MYNDIDTLLLDLGGVLIDVDYTASARAFKALGFADFDALYSKAKQDHLFDGFETGALSPGQFRDRIRQLFRPDISDERIDACWNAMLGSIPPARIELIHRLKERFRVLLLSNTNAIHVPAFSEIIRRENGIADFKSLFHGAYYSCEIGLRKPDVEVYRYVLGEHHASAERTLFIDDSLHHVQGARRAGLKAEHLMLENEDVLGLVDRLGLDRQARSGVPAR
ncbi:MAG TPA: HAD family phosphatase [Flavobacteriales bacterium]|nr:HAD family phosphatase [Flavobacteriales bacterium]